MPALANLMQSISPSNMAVTGGDPLRNPRALDVIATNHKGFKSIMVSPLTFLCVEAGKPASKITAEDIGALESRVKQHGLSQATLQVAARLTAFNRVYWSSSLVQAPAPMVKSAANRLFMRVEHAVESVSPYTVVIPDPRGFYWQGDSVYGPSLKCVGRLRMHAEAGSVVAASASRAGDMKPKDSWCAESNEIAMMFAKDDQGVSLYFTGCVNAASTRYTSWRTGLTIDEMATMGADDIAGCLRGEHRLQKQSACYQLLNNPWYTGLPWGRKHYEMQFEFYLRAAVELISLRTGSSVDIVHETFTMGGPAAHQCEVCNTASLMMHRAGITPQEWQAHLEEKVKG